MNVGVVVVKMALAKVTLLLIIARSVTGIRVANDDSHLFLFLNQTFTGNSSYLSPEPLCGGTLLTRYHILTTENCARKIKKQNLRPVTLSQLEEEDVSEGEEGRGQISEIYLEKEENFAILLLARPELSPPQFSSRRRPNRKRNQVLASLAFFF